MTLIRIGSAMLAAWLLVLTYVPAAGAGSQGPIVFFADDSIFSVRPDGQAYRRLAQGDLISHPIWSPRKDLIAFARNDGTSDSVWVMDADGTNERRVASDGFDPVWSPDGQRLVFVRRERGAQSLTTPTQLVVVDVDGGDEVVVAEAPESDLWGAQWSPHGSEIVFVATTSTDDGDPRTFDEDNRDIYKVVLATGEVIRLTDDPGWDEDPRWSPDGRRLAFVSDRDDEICPPDGGCPYATEIYLMERDGTDEVRFTHNSSRHDRGHEWSPDGREIVWQQTVDDDVNSGCCSADILIKTVGGGQRRLLTDDRRRIDLDPSFSPSGRWIVFLSFRDRSLPDLFKIRRTGTARTRITSSRRAEQAPDW